MKKVMMILNTIASYETEITKMFDVFNTFNLLPADGKSDAEIAYDAECDAIFKKLTNEFFSNIFNNELDIEVTIEHGFNNSVQATIDYGHSLNDGELNINYMSYHKTFSTME